MLDPRTDEQLAAEAAREESAGPAFAALVARFQQRVWRICYRLMGDEHEASDAAQEVFLQVFLHRQRFRGESKYSTWLHGVALRTCLAMRRGFARRRRREGIAQETALRQQQAGSRETPPSVTLDIRQMLNILEEDERALLLMKYAEGYSHEELAEMFELSVSACKMRIQRAREKLQQRFPGHEFGSAEN